MPLLDKVQALMWIKKRLWRWGEGPSIGNLLPGAVETEECKVLKVVREIGTRILQCKCSCSSTLQKQPEEGSPETVINLEIIESIPSLAFFTNAQKI